MPNTDKITFLPQLQRYDQKIKGWADNKFLTKADTPSLPKATATTLGGVKVGSGLSVTDDGTLSTSGAGELTIVEVSSSKGSLRQEQYDTIATLWPNVLLRWATELYHPVDVLGGSSQPSGFLFATSKADYYSSSELMIPICGIATVKNDLSFTIKYSNLPIADPRHHSGYGIMAADGTTLQCDYSGKIYVRDGGITSAKLIDGAVTVTKLASDAVTTDKITNGAVASVKLASGAVTADKIADGTITANKIADGVIDVATDVRIAGKSITADGVADIPAAVGNEDDSNKNSYGVVKSRGLSFGILLHKNGICTAAAAENEIDSRKNHFKPIPPAMLDYSVKAAMCDGKGAAWTAAEKLAARERLGIGKYELIEEITLSEDAAIVRTATPSGKQYAFSKVLVDFIVPSQSDNKSYYMRFDNTDIQPNIWTIGEKGSELHFSQWAYCESGKMFQFAHSTATQNGLDRSNVISSTRIPEVGTIEYLRIWAYKPGNANLPAGTNIKIYGVWA